ncbi:MAG TPA: PH domain-containing protein, partial [Chloroflexota bacterium]|nr:PH domain-containing protein [Chloroflexota bacterium]
LNRIFHAQAAGHDAPTQRVPRVSVAAARMPRRLNLLPDEVVVHATRRHPMVLIMNLVLPLFLVAAGLVALRFLPPAPLLGVLACAVCVLLWVAWIVLEWRDDLYVLTTDRVIEVQRKPFISELGAVVQLRALQDVVLRISSISGRLFNMGTLTLEAGSEPLRFIAVPHPEQFQRLIFEQIDEAAQRDRFREQERLAGTLTEWFKEYHRMQEETAGGGPPP